MKTIVLISLLAFTRLSASFVEVQDMTWKYWIREDDDFEDLESLIKYKAKFFRSLTPKVIEIQSDDDMYRFFYFHGKTMAYESVIQSSK